MAAKADCETGEALFNGAPACALLCFAAFARGQGRDARSRASLAGTVNAVFEAGQLFRAHRATGVELAGGYADFGTEAELPAVSELGRGVVQHDRRIDFFEK